MVKRRVPTREQALAGVLPVLQNADAHLGAADALATRGFIGFAVAHLVYAIEESEKARPLAKIALGESLTDAEIRSALYEHRERHLGALAKSLSAGGTVMDYLAESLRERVGLSPPRTDDERRDMINERHPDVLPSDWPETAGGVREHALYVDLRDDGWHSPQNATEDEYSRLRPSVVTLLRYLAAAYEREIAPLLSPSVSTWVPGAWWRYQREPDVSERMRLPDRNPRRLPWCLSAARPACGEVHRLFRLEPKRSSACKV
jgi:AbiV family abortive infection protein